jgi:hypothetical protein
MNKLIRPFLYHLDVLHRIVYTLKDIKNICLSSEPQTVRGPRTCLAEI